MIPLYATNENTRDLFKQSAVLGCRSPLYTSPAILLILFLHSVIVSLVCVLNLHPSSNVIPRYLKVGVYFSISPWNTSVGLVPFFQLLLDPLKHMSCVLSALNLTFLSLAHFRRSSKKVCSTIVQAFLT